MCLEGTRENVAQDIDALVHMQHVVVDVGVVGRTIGSMNGMSNRCNRPQISSIGAAVRRSRSRSLRRWAIRWMVSWREVPEWTISSFSSTCSSMVLTIRM